MKSIIRGIAIVLMAGVLSGCMYSYDPDDLLYYPAARGDCHRHAVYCDHQYSRDDYCRQALYCHHRYYCDGCYYYR